MFFQLKGKSTNKKTENQYTIDALDYFIHFDNTRHDIVTMLNHEIYVENNRFGSAESYEMLREKYPRFLRLDQVVIPEEHMEFTMDFSNALNSAPYTAMSTMLMPAVYSLFRNMGMRVIDSRILIHHF